MCLSLLVLSHFSCSLAHTHTHTHAHTDTHTWPTSPLTRSGQLPKPVPWHLRLHGHNFFFCKPLEIFLPCFYFRQFLNIHGWILYVFHIPDLSPHSGHWHMFHAALIYSWCRIIWHWVSFLFDRFPGRSCWKHSLYLRHVSGPLSTSSFTQCPLQTTQPC